MPCVLLNDGEMFLQCNLNWNPNADVIKQNPYITFFVTLKYNLWTPFSHAFTTKSTLVVPLSLVDREKNKIRQKTNYKEQPLCYIYLNREKILKKRLVEIARKRINTKVLNK